jgi:hypothetical protein
LHGTGNGLPEIDATTYTAGTPDCAGKVIQNWH